MPKKKLVYLRAYKLKLLTHFFLPAYPISYYLYAGWVQASFSPDFACCHYAGSVGFVTKMYIDCIPALSRGRLNVKYGIRYGVFVYRTLKHANFGRKFYQSNYELHDWIGLLTINLSIQINIAMPNNIKKKIYKNYNIH